MIHNAGGFTNEVCVVNVTGRESLMIISAILTTLQGLVVQYGAVSIPDGDLDGPPIECGESRWWERCFSQRLQKANPLVCFLVYLAAV